MAGWNRRTWACLPSGPAVEPLGKLRHGADYLQLLQLAHVALALGHHVPHLVLVFLLLLQPLGLLPLLLLLGELQREEGTVAARPGGWVGALPASA